MPGGYVRPRRHRSATPAVWRCGIAFEAGSCSSPNRRSLGVEVLGIPRMELLSIPDVPDGNCRDVFTGRHVKVEAGPAA
jgi:hypothetical protein